MRTILKKLEELIKHIETKKLKDNLEEIKEDIKLLNNPHGLKQLVGKKSLKEL